MNLHLFKSLFRSGKSAIHTKQPSNFFEEFEMFRTFSEARPKRFPLRWEDRFPCLEDRSATTDFDRHYVYHTAWAARVIAELKPSLHIDIASSLYFATIVSAFVPVEFYDYRPAELKLNGLQSKPGDLMRLPFADGSVASLSCMHVVEHIGLGRYGDPLDPDGDLKAISELKRVLAPGGSLLFVTPTGRPKIRFNAHRIYAYRQIVEYFSMLRLSEFSLVPDNPSDGGLIIHASEGLADKQEYGCGCYWFTKTSS